MCTPVTVALEGPPALMVSSGGLRLTLMAPAASPKKCWGLSVTYSLAAPCTNETMCMQRVATAAQLVLNPSAKAPRSQTALKHGHIPR